MTENREDALIAVFGAYPLRGLTIGFGSLSLIGLASVIGGVVGDVTGWVAFGAILLLICPTITYITARMSFLRGRLSDRDVTTPGLLFGWRTTELADIAGVGLRFLSDGRATGWRTVLWRQDGTRVGLMVPGPKQSAPPGQRRRLRPMTNWVPPLDWDYINDSPAGKAARQIYDATLALQGRDGLLASKQSQVSASTIGGFETAYWSPDGRIGPLAPLG